MLENKVKVVGTNISGSTVSGSGSGVTIGSQQTNVGNTGKKKKGQGGGTKCNRFDGKWKRFGHDDWFSAD